MTDIKNGPKTTESESTINNENVVLPASLRDYFASKAEIAESDYSQFKNHHWVELIGEKMPGLDNPLALLEWQAKAEAMVRYIKADAMLKERAKTS